MTEVGPVSHGETETPFPRPATQQSLTSLQHPEIPSLGSPGQHGTHNGQYLRTAMGESPSEEASASGGCETT